MVNKTKLPNKWETTQIISIVINQTCFIILKTTSLMSKLKKKRIYIYIFLNKNIWKSLKMKMEAR